MDTFVFQSSAKFLDSLFFPGIHETWMRIIIFSFFIFIGLFSQNIISKRKKTPLLTLTYLTHSALAESEVKKKIIKKYVIRISTWNFLVMLIYKWSNICVSLKVSAFVILKIYYFCKKIVFSRIFVQAYHTTQRIKFASFAWISQKYICNVDLLFECVHVKFWRPVTSVILTT